MRYVIFSILAVLISQFCSAQHRNIFDLLKTDQDYAYYSEQGLYQKANHFFNVKKYSKAKKLYIKCLQAGYIHPKLKVELLYCLQILGELDEANLYIPDFNKNIKPTIYFSLYQSLNFIDLKCYSRAQKVLNQAITSQVNLKNYDSIAIAVAYSYLAYCKLLKQASQVNLMDIGSMSPCKETINLDNVDAICCYYKAIKLGLKDSVIHQNVLHLDSLYKIKEPLYKLPGELGVIEDWGKKSETSFERIILPKRDTMMFSWFNKKDEIVMIFDHSGSMLAKVNTPNGKITRMELMQAEALHLLALLKEHRPDIKVGAVSVGLDCSVEPLLNYRIDTANFNKIIQSVQNLTAQGMTPLNKILLKVDTLFSTDSNSSKGLLIFSDGRNSCSRFKHGGSCYIGDYLAHFGIQSAVYSLLPDKTKNSKAFGVYECIAERTGGVLITINEKYELEILNKEKLEPKYRLLVLRNFVTDDGKAGHFILKDEYKQDMEKCNNLGN